MTYMPITPFGRPVDAVHLDHQAHAIRGDAPGLGVNKWEALRALAVARERFGLSDRDLSVLQALLSFHPSAILAGAAGLVVHPANRTISGRLNGMPCSTLRRHLARLVAAGVILRRDSPNGKRYARRVAGEKVAFGFDLSPMVTRFGEFQAEAAEVHAEKAARAALREEVSLMRRDLVGLLAEAQRRGVAPPVWQALSELVTEVTKALRRRLDRADLQRWAAELARGLQSLDAAFAEEMTPSDSQNEQHIESNQLDLYEEAVQRPETPRPGAKKRLEGPNVATVVRACPKLRVFYPDRLEHDHDLIRAADHLAPMLGLSRSVWTEAGSRLGRYPAAVVLAVMLQRFDKLRCPSAYLRHLAASPAVDLKAILASSQV